RRHCFEDSSVIDQKNSRVRHEQFEAGHTLIDECFQLRQPLVWKISEDHVKSVIDRRLALCFCKPYIERLIQRLATILHSEIDDCGGTAEGGRSSSSFEVIGSRSAPEGQVHVRVRIDSTGENELAAGID